MNTSLLKDLINVSSYIGQRVPLWNQGFGGNISVKEIDLMFIKATGKQLQNLSQKEDLAAVRWKEVQSLPIDLTEQDYKDRIFNSSIKTEGWGRPSMETGLHSNSEKKWVIHFHSVPMVLAAQAWAKGQNEIIESIFENEGLKVAFISKQLPGLELNKEFSKLSPFVNVVMIMCHGVVLRSEDESIIKQFEKAERNIIDHFGWRFDQPEKFISPLKAYFPDTAVYWSELLRFLGPTSDGLYTIREDAPFYIKEIWAAQHYLYENDPALESFNEKEISTITSLPTEQLRKKICN